MGEAAQVLPRTEVHASGEIHQGEKFSPKEADFYLGMSKIDAGSLIAGRSINTRIPTNDAHAPVSVPAHGP